MVNVYHKLAHLFCSFHLSFAALHQFWRLFQWGPVPLQFCLPDVVIAIDVTPDYLVFHLSDKVVALHFKNSTAKIYLCNQGGTVYLFPSRLTCHILNLANRHDITLNPAYTPTISIWKSITYCRKDWFQNCIFFLAKHKEYFQHWGHLEVDMLASSYTNQF